MGKFWTSIDNDPPLTLRKDKCIFVALETLGSGLTVFLLVFREPFAHRSNRFLACLFRSVPQETTNQKTRASRAKNNQQDRGMMGGALFSASCLGLCDQRTVGSGSGKGSMFKWPLKQDAKVDADGYIFSPSGVFERWLQVFPEGFRGMPKLWDACLHLFQRRGGSMELASSGLCHFGPFTMGEYPKRLPVW